jgi:hypothetical protein
MSRDQRVLVLGEIDQQLSVLPCVQERGSRVPALTFKALEHSVLVGKDDLQDPVFDDAVKKVATPDKMEHQRMLLQFLVDELSPRSPAIATGIALHRALHIGSSLEAEPDELLAKMLLDNKKVTTTQAGKIDFSDPSAPAQLQLLAGSAGRAAVEPTVDPAIVLQEDRQWP